MENYSKRELCPVRWRLTAIAAILSIKISTSPEAAYESAQFYRIEWSCGRGQRSQTNCRRRDCFQAKYGLRKFSSHNPARPAKYSAAHGRPVAHGLHRNLWESPYKNAEPGSPGKRRHLFYQCLYHDPNVHSRTNGAADRPWTVETWNARLYKNGDAALSSGEGECAGHGRLLYDYDRQESLQSHPQSTWISPSDLRRALQLLVSQWE